MVHIGVWHRAKSSVGVVVGGCRVGQKDHPVVAKHSVARCRMAAILRGRARDDHGIDTPLAQDHVKVSAIKTAVTMLLDDMLARCRSNLRVDVHSSTAID